MPRTRKREVGLVNRRWAGGEDAGRLGVQAVVRDGDGGSMEVGQGILVVSSRNRTAALERRNGSIMLRGKSLTKRPGAWHSRDHRVRRVRSDGGFREELPAEEIEVVADGKNLRLVM